MYDLPHMGVLMATLRLAYGAKRYGVARRIKKMAKVGDKYFLDGASQHGITRNKEIIEIKPYSIVTKIRDNFSDKLKFRNMWKLDKTGCEVSIAFSIIDRYFRPISEMNR